MPHSPERRAYLLLLAVIFLWGINWPIMKAGLAYISPLWFAASRVALAAAFLFPLLAALGRLRPPRRGDVGVLLSVGVGQVGVNIALVHLGLQFIEAGRSAILAYTTPLWVAPLAALFLGERLSVRKLLGIALGLVGVFVLSGPAALDLADTATMTGNGLLVLAAMISAAVIVHMRAQGRAVQAFELAPWQMLLGAAVLVPAALLFDGPPAVQWSVPLVAVLAYNGALATAFCLWAFVVVMRDLPATSTAVGSLGVPVVGVLTSAILLGEPLSAAKMLGLALILGGVLAVSLADLRRA
ncbi:DMT family transporter [Shumkonia mesophila]|uniref:DMT family transporter n=1 Tax=Shumkonia mesophila TaxID=2838854 RepID=UPI00293522DA|nr:DMT family transporter [Shumkonia mesophila]